MALKRNKNTIKRTARVYLNDLNVGKFLIVREFLAQCHDVMQYFVDLFWQRKDFSGKLADLPTVHKARERFGITTRLGQALAKQASECVCSQRKKNKKRKPQLRWHTVTLFYHFVTISPFKKKGFDWCVKLIGSGAPKLVIPLKSTSVINQRLAQGWQLSKTIRMGLKKGRLWIDFIFEKVRPPLKTSGQVVGMDSNYKNGVVFSDSQVVGQSIYQRINEFQKRQKHTHAEIKSRLGQALKKVDWSSIKVLSIEDLKKVKHGKRGTFSRVFNRRLSHWLYRTLVQWLERKCEEEGIQLVVKDPFKTSQFCSSCNRWDRRNRKGDSFKCVYCGYLAHADHNAAHNLELLGVAGVYGLRSYLNSKSQSFE
ncbi:zinc ribbon domain-containing protein [Coleofasciculus sp. E1-EBD-02]|uniref:zinc ribbon domain-containing protein n=1 Tax=Coleofasciculus sp. E1-EBD-02 TaxID=3068481 RepID=UPI0033022704